MTDEYIQARKAVASMVYGSDNTYSRCVDSVSKMKFFLALAQCTEADAGKDIDGGCAHLVGYGAFPQEVSDDHCEVFSFEPSVEMAKNILHEKVDAEGITKCK